MRTRQAGRDRIARDLHDTLLQGVQGLGWRIRAAANGIAPQAPFRSALEGAQDKVEELVAERGLAGFAVSAERPRTR